MAVARGMVWTALLAAACHDLPPFEYEGDKVRVGMYADAQLCAGDLARMDAFVRQVELDLDAHADERIDVYLFDEFNPPSSMPKGCARGGCFDRKNERIFTNAGMLQHELVHAVVHRIGKPVDLFYNEGIAEALTDARTIFGRTLPADNLGRKERSLDARASLDDRTAAHFMRWLWEEHDRDAFRRLARGSSFASAYDGSFADAEAAYLTDAPWAYPRRKPCTAPPMVSLGNHGWDETFSFSCDDENTFTLDVYGERSEEEWYARHVIRTITIDEGGTFNFTSSESGVGAVFVLGCQLEPVAEAPQQRPMGWGLLLEERHWTLALQRFMLFDIATRIVPVPLPAGTYELVVREPRRADSVRVRVSAALESRRTE